MFWTPSADSYPNARKTTPYGGMTVEASIASEGRACSQKQMVAMPDSNNLVIQIPVAIAADCERPVVSVKLLGKNSDVLDEMVAEIFNSTPGQEERFAKVTGIIYNPADEPSVQSGGNSWALPLIGAVIVILVVLIAAVVLIRKRAKK